MKMKHHGIAGRLNHCEQSAHHHAAGEYITHGESYGKCNTANESVLAMSFLLFNFNPGSYHLPLLVLNPIDSFKVFDKFF